MYPESGSAMEYSGRGLIVFPASGTAIFNVQVPRDHRYEIILRLQVQCMYNNMYVMFIHAHYVIDSLKLLISDVKKTTQILVYSCTVTRYIINQCMV